MKKRISLLLIACLSAALMAQEPLWMEPDRPGAATAPTVMPFKAILWETGFDASFTSGATSFTLPTTLFRFGIAPFAELRIEGAGELAQQTSQSWTYSPKPLTIGTKLRIFDGSETHRWIPQTALLVQLAVPTTSSMAQTMHIAPSVYALFANDITSWFNIAYNLGLEWDGASTLPQTFVALCLGFSITDQLGAFVESYNYITGYGAKLAGNPYIDAGFNWLVHPRVQLDLSASIYAPNPKTNSSLSLGVSWRLN